MPLENVPTMRFHLDEHMAHAVATGLRRRGLDVTTTVEARLLGFPDVDQISFAREENRVIVTQDADFLRLHQAGIPHVGIVFLPSGAHDIGELVRFLCLMHDCVPAEEMVNIVEYL